MTRVTNALSLAKLCDAERVPEGHPASETAARDPSGCRQLVIWQGYPAGAEPRDGMLALV